VVEITLEGLAALQGIPLTELPISIEAAWKAIRNGINRMMHEYAMSMGVLYTNQYLLVVKGKRDESTPTTTAVDEIEERPKDIDYKNLLTRLTLIKETESQVNETTTQTVITNHTNTISRMAVLSRRRFSISLTSTSKCKGISSACEDTEGKEQQRH
jgi:hypothetical protein